MSISLEKEREKENEKEHSKGEQDSYVDSESESAALNSSDTSDCVISSDFEPILEDDYPLTELAAHARQAVAEFDKLSSELIHDTSIAKCEKNRVKNRYVNIIPYDYARVKLNSPNDYINASYIRSLDGSEQQAYVVTQGPIPRTMEDFWRMVWEQKATVIVVLGKEIENARVKIDRYWPPDSPREQRVQSYGPFNVTLESMLTYGDSQIFVRVLTIEYEKETHKVYHCQYSGWPDHSVPESTRHIRQFIYVLHDLLGSSLPKPVVLHCSAGVGRSGTFCTAHMVYEYFVKMILAKKIDDIRINVFKIVSILRDQRAGMVQQLNQYSFCYQVIHDLAVDLSLLKTDVPCDKVVIPKELRQNR